jgi:hypothetical protein
MASSNIETGVYTDFLIIAMAAFLRMLLLRIPTFEAGPYSEVVLETALFAVLSTPEIYIRR